MNDVAGRIRALTPDKLEQLAERLRRKGTAAARPRVTPRVDVPGPLPLSFAQERLWFIDQLRPGSSAYNVPSVMRVRAPLDVRAIERTLDELVRRHESLRTSFEIREGRPVQVVHTPRPLGLRVTDLGHLPEPEREIEAHRLASIESLTPFELHRAPLFRAHLIRLCETDHVLVLTMHHIVSDGWSLTILFHELGQLYDAFLQDRPSPLREVPVQYADYALWQRAHMSGAVLDEHVAFFRKALAGAPPLLALPTDRPRPAVQSFRGGVHGFTLPPDVGEALRVTGHAAGATLFMTLLAVYAALLGRYARESDVVIGSPIANRTRAEIEETIGFFVNTLVLRVDLTGDPTFRQLVRRVREVTLGAYAHQDLPFEKLVEELHPERSLGHNPLFQVTFGLQTTPGAPRAESAGAANDPGRGASAPPPVIDGTAKFDLTLAMIETEGGIAGAIEYASDLFDAETVARMAGHFVTLATEAARRPDAPLPALPLLDDAERALLLGAFAGLPPEPRTGPFVMRLLREQAARTPSAIAVCFEDQAITYAELDAWSRRLAAHLARRGLGRGSIVGVCVDRSIEMIVAVYGILGAGAAYLPLDPAYPRGRLALMIEDSGLRAVVTEERHRAIFAPYGADVVAMDTDAASIAGEGGDFAFADVEEDDLAYVIYTSGSTGKPKGAMLTHGGLRNLVEAQRATFALDAADHVLQFSSLSFDASLFDIVLALGAGAWLEVASKDALMPGPPLARLLDERAITVATIPPSALAVVPVAPLPKLRVLLAAAEAPSADLLARWSLPGRRIYNAYGPTETTICAFIGEYAPRAGRPPIGRPFPNVRAYVLDERLEPVPIGVMGELYLGGDGVGLGYLARPGLTASRFVPDPYLGARGARMYRTGDLVRFLADGRVEFIRRLDQQVKIRGFRVEPGEIEEALARHPRVREAVVVTREAAGEARLVAYVVRDAGPDASARELRASLRAELPEHMVPSAIVMLDALPVTPNGKVDRAALPSPERAEPAEGADLAMPQTPLEAALAAIFRELLAVPRVGMTDGFFELGGHSLLVTRVVSRIREQLGVEVPMRVMFEAPTVRELAAAVAALSATAPKGPREGAIPRLSREAHRVKDPRSTTDEDPRRSDGRAR